MENFEEWWARVGRMIDPDTEDVSWFDKRKALAEHAFMTALAQSCNYTADDSTFPRQVQFGNGRIVRIEENLEGDERPYLEIEIERDSTT